MTASPACVLIADDDEDDRFLLARAFTHHCPEYPIQFAQDGLALLSELERSQWLPALIMLDLNMPLLDGFETLTYLQAHPQFREVPVIILSTSEAETDRQQAQVLGARLFITKPIDSAELGQAILRLKVDYLDGKC